MANTFYVDQFRDPKNLAYIVYGLLGVQVIALVIGIITALGLLTSPEWALDLDAGESMPVFILFLGLAELLRIGAFILTAIFFLIWVHRAFSNLSPLGARVLELRNRRRRRLLVLGTIQIIMLGFILVIFAVWFGYKKAKATGRHPILWAFLSAAAFVGTQVVVGFAIGLTIAFAEGARSGWQEDVIEQSVDQNIAVISIVSLIASFISLWLVFRFLDKAPTEPDVQQPPPPPTFDDNDH